MTLDYITAPTYTDIFRQVAIQHQINIEHHKEVSLINFFDHYHGQKPYPISAYLTYASRYQIDYRLLPAISAIESQAGRHACGNNWWGWQSCKGNNFSSVPEGIEFVSQKLGTGNHYRGKSTINKLRAYNHNPSYAPEVERLIKEISDEQLN
jgi:hypothetical protein